MLTVKQLLSSKPTNQVFSVLPSNTVYEALELMALRNIGAVVVLNGENLVGIFSERDYARKGIIKDRKAKSTPVSEVMTPKVVTVTPQQNIEDCMQLMSEKHFRHLPVTEEGKVIGLLSVGDIVTAILREQKDRIHSLEQYIMMG
jgi:CBS domain-containing protein